MSGPSCINQEFRACSFGSGFRRDAPCRRASQPAGNDPSRRLLKLSFRPFRVLCCSWFMTKRLEQAVDTVRTLPAKIQDDLARLLLQLAGHEQRRAAYGC
jgi:hypothetical protein